MPPLQTQFFTKTHEAWEVMLADIKAATVSIDFEQYIFANDTIGMKFFKLFEEKLQQGVKVRILCDMVGSLSFYQSRLPDLLRKMGAEVKFFNPISLWRITNFTSHFFRDHRKMLVVDGHVAHIGGVGVQDHMAAWRDTHVRIVGPLVGDFMKSFQVLWDRAGKSVLARFKRSPQFIKNYNLLTNAPRMHQRFIYQALILNIRNAQKYVYLSTPYFIPDIRLFRILRLAAKRGVDVRLMVPEIADHLFVNHARESYFTLALKAGIKIYIYTPVMMHTKTAVIDDAWATVGSFNLDSLSFMFNHEANVSSSDPQFIQTLKHHFADDIQVCRELTYEAWIRRPLRKKFLELLTWPFHKIM